MKIAFRQLDQHLDQHEKMERFDSFQSVGQKEKNRTILEITHGMAANKTKRGQTRQ
jgi:hypothetical protein